MRLEWCQPILLCLHHSTIVQLQQVSVGRQYSMVDIGGTPGLYPVIRSDKHDQPLLSRIDHMGKGLLKHGITFLNRQQSKNIGIGGDALAHP